MGRRTMWGVLLVAPFLIHHRTTTLKENHTIVANERDYWRESAGGTAQWFIEREREPLTRRLGCAIVSCALIELGGGWNKKVAEIDATLVGAEDDGRRPGPGPLGRWAAQMAREPFLDPAADQPEQHGAIDCPF